MSDFNKNLILFSKNIYIWHMLDTQFSSAYELINFRSVALIMKKLAFFDVFLKNILQSFHRPFPSQCIKKDVYTTTLSISNLTMYVKVLFKGI